MKYIFIDMDNTIAENTTCEDIEFHEGLYLNKRPIKVVIDAIRALYPNSLYIIFSKTAGGHDGRAEKGAWLEKYLPETHLAVFIEPEDSKSECIESFINSSMWDKKDCLVIDDKKSILQECLALGINVKYPQQIICDFESLTKNN